ncbi:PKD domain-containing protein [Roseibium algae]|uniref:PKD domain-containing protein n=1 Tax=Roseibium algae TaxID=3123038 RepID=A0ABU8THP0_9HYPH
MRKMVAGMYLIKAHLEKMKRAFNHVRVIAVGIACATLLANSPAYAQSSKPIDVPLLVTYGAEAPTREGDPTHRQIIYIEVPKTLKQRIYIRLFDPDTGGDHDLLYGPANTQTRFILFGGEGAFPENPSSGRDVSDAELTSGSLLTEKTYGDSTRFDNQWTNFAFVSPDQGEELGAKRIFRLVVDGAEGNDGNLYGVAVSLKDKRQVDVKDAKLFSYAPTIRVPDTDTLTELRFTAPETATRLAIDNFDAAHGKVALTTAFRSVPLTPSGQDEWRSDQIELAIDELGKPAAITLSGGHEIPNDATFFITVRTDKLLPLDLPPFNWVPNNRPDIQATATMLGGCTSVAFDASGTRDADGDRLSYLWRFSDGTTMTGPSVVKPYEATGHFSERLEVTDSSGQIAHGSAQELDVLIRRAPVPRISVPGIVATGETITLDGSGSTSDGVKIQHYDWTFNDGTEAIGPRITRSFSAPGVYQTTLSIQDNSGHPCDTAELTTSILANAAPVAVAGTNQRTEIGTELIFDGSDSYDTDGQLTSHLWDMGDGTAIDGEIVQHAFSEPGNYAVSLKVTDDTSVSNNSSVDTVQVFVNAPPVADAGPDQAVALAEVVEFDGSASNDPDGKIISYLWDFGDGTTATGETTTYAYAAPGTFEVRLTITDDSGTRSQTAFDMASIRVNAPPVANAGPDQVVTASAVQFDGSASSDTDDQIERFEWDFGDGSTGRGAAPNHVYARPGTYPVRLTVTDASGTVRNSDSDLVLITINSPPIADAGPNLIGAPGEELIFQASRSIDPDGDIAAYEWDFKDGTQATGEITAHSFAKPGRYFVQLKVTDNTGHAKAIDYDETEVFINAPPVANAGDDIRVAPGQIFTLDAGRSSDSDGSVTDFRWDITGIDEPFYTETVDLSLTEPGSYTALLTVSDDSGVENSLSEDKVTIRVNHAPFADAGDDVFTGDSLVLFDAGKSLDADGDGLTYTWDFADGQTAEGAQVAHTFAAGGTYPVVLTVSDGTGLSNGTDRDAMTVTINHAPVAEAGENAEICTGDILVLDGSKSRDPDGGVLKYAWDFGDGDSSDIVNPTKKYRRGGSYPVTLTVTDNSGLSNNQAKDRIAVTVNQAPVADAGADMKICANTEVFFDGSKSWDADGVVNRYLWDFGDGRSSGGDKPGHSFRKPGTYRVRLTIEGDQVGQCDTRATDEIKVEVIAAPVPRIEAVTSVPVGAPMTLDGSTSYLDGGLITGWSWDFGDGTSAEGALQTHVFKEPGVYRIALKVDSDAASSDCAAITGYHEVTVNAAPIADAGEDIVVGVNEEFVLDGSASSDPDGALASHTWVLGDGSTFEGVAVRHRFAAPGRYEISLTVTDTAGLANSSATDTLTVVVHDGVAAVLEAPDAVCVGEEVTLSAARSTSQEAPIIGFDWSFGDGTKANAETVTKRFVSPGRYNVSVLVDDGMGRTSSQREASKIILVNQPPIAVAGPNRLACPGAPVRFDASASSDADGAIGRYEWDFGDGMIGAGVTPEHSFDRPGTYNITLKVTDTSGASCSVQEDTLTVTVNAPPAADAGPDREIFVGGANDAEQFSAWRSYDPDGTDLDHVWDFGPDGKQRGERVSQSFSAPGDYEVKLTVSDGSGLSCGTASDNVTVKVREREAY